MSRAAVRQYVAGLLLNIPDVDTYTYHPKVEAYTDLVIVGRITSSEKRASVPRGGGRKRIDSEVGVIVGVERVIVEEAVQRTDEVVQTILLRLRGAPLPTVITDPTSGEESTVLLVGEDIRITEDRLEMVGDIEGTEGMVHSMITLQVPVTEIIQA